MKNILKITALAFLLISFASCTDTIDPKVSPNGFKLNALDPTGPFVLSPLDGDNLLTTVTWGPADSGVTTVSAKYTVEIAKGGTNFAKPIVASTTSTALKVVWQEGYINALLLDNGFVPDAAVDIDIRVKSVLGESANPFVQYSNIVSMKVTPFAQLLLAFTKVGDNPATAPTTKSSSLYTSDTEGYAWLEVGSYKFYTATGGVFQSTNPFYGDDGSGALVLNGAAINVTTAGFYLIKADISKSPKTYSLTTTEWGIFGTAKPFPTGVNRKMIYNNVSKKWELTIILNGGKGFKFRNTATTLILGAFNSAKVGVDYAGTKMSYNGGDINLPGLTPSTYTVTLDLNSPRAYTYTLVKQ
ncbi:SusE domain-containing protein [Flavobacterium sp.]|uniref:SusE domain-containing protein n=1 Tax=Flavobacterium sp. TaxID=239 RepID=UPI0037536F7E